MLSPSERKSLEDHVYSVLGESSWEPEDLIKALKNRSCCGDQKAKEVVWAMLGQSMLELDEDWKIKAVPRNRLKPA